MQSGARQPSLPVLARILAAVDLEPRITLQPYDAHDDVVGAEDARLTDAHRASRRKVEDEFAAQMRAR